MTLARRGLLASVLGLLGGCSPAALLNTTVARSGYTLDADIPYGTLPRQKLDIYKPKGNVTGAPVVLFFYGGNWTRGERADYRFVGEALAASGAIAIVADYRLSPQVRWQQILQDCALATKWAIDHTAVLGGDARRVYLMGHSAGGYNAAMLALDDRWLAAQGLSPQRLAGWIGLAGPYDFLPIVDPEVRIAFNWPDTPPDSQPVNHAAGKSPRALLLAPINDKVVSPTRSTQGLGKRLQAAGVPVKFELLEKVNHATIAGAIARPLNFLAPVLSEILAFVGLPPRG